MLSFPCSGPTLSFTDPTTISQVSQNSLKQSLGVALSSTSFKTSLSANASNIQNLAADGVSLSCANVSRASTDLQSHMLTILPQLNVVDQNPSNLEVQPGLSNLKYKLPINNVNVVSRAITNNSMQEFQNFAKIDVSNDCGGFAFSDATTGKQPAPAIFSNNHKFLSSQNGLIVDNEQQGGFVLNLNAVNEPNVIFTNKDAIQTSNSLHSSNQGTLILSNQNSANVPQVLSIGTPILGQQSIFGGVLGQQSQHQNILLSTDDNEGQNAENNVNVGYLNSLLSDKGAGVYVYYPDGNRSLLIDASGGGGTLVPLNLSHSEEEASAEELKEGQIISVLPSAVELQSHFLDRKAVRGSQESQLAEQSGTLLMAGENGELLQVIASNGLYCSHLLTHFLQNMNF